MIEGGYRVEVRQRPTGSIAFRWEIYRGAGEKPVAASFYLFRSAQVALLAGKRALARLQAQSKPEPPDGE
jgi:hypothetical protein